MTLPVENLAINTIRTLVMDSIQAAKSGHPGTPMSMAPVAYLLYNEIMNYDPAHPLWSQRDRFVLSAGHGSTLLYSVLHLAGVEQYEDGKPTGEKAVRIEDLKSFRQLNSRCPGHPEYGHTSGVEVTTGPLGQGLAMSVGHAIASKWFSAKYARDGKDLFGFNVYSLCGDGCMMEGVSSEAASLAAHLKLSNLCWIYDSNRITIEGSTDLAFTEDVAARFEAYGWNVVRVAEDVNDLDALRRAFAAFQAETERPTLIMVKSVIGYGSPNLAGTAKVHGAPLGEDEIVLTKQFLGWNYEKFAVPEEVSKLFADGIQANGAKAYAQWESDYAEYCAKYPAEAKELSQIAAGELPEGWDAGIKQMWEPNEKGDASRNSSGKVLNQVAAGIPWMIGGSADLAPSNKSNLTFEGAGDFGPKNYAGRNFHFGIREFAMAAICNGMATCGIRSYCATFFVFCDYLRGALRLSCLMRLPVLYIFSHDSIGVGEDGPTHQPVEQLAALRSMPNLVVFRPCDANEVRFAYRWYAENQKNPVCMVVTRQNLPTLPRAVEPTGDVCACSCGVAKGAYVIRDAKNPATGTCDAILLGSGSEVHVCLDAQKILASKGVYARVVSVPSMELFERQSAEYRESVLPKAVTRRVAVEAALQFGWDRYIGPEGKFVGMTDFGASAPYKQLYEYYGITAENVAETVLNIQ